MNKRYLVAGATLLLTAGTLAHAGDAESLIALDKKWGESSDAVEVSNLLADEMVVLNPDGNGSKAGVIENATNPEGPAGPYTPEDYVVKFISDDVAVMTHGTSGEDPHWSLHVWQKQDGEWKVAATANIPAEE